MTRPPETDATAPGNASPSPSGLPGRTGPTEPPVRRARHPFRLAWGWLLVAALVFLVELFIALHVHDHWIRPYGGDALVVVLVYAVVRAFVGWPWRPVLLGTCLFAFAVEGLQALHLVRHLHLEGSRLWSTVLGTFADPSDLVSYAVGGVGLLAVELVRERRWRTGRLRP